MTDKLDAIPGSTGRKIIDGLKDAAAGNFASVTIEGQRWVRADAPQAGMLSMPAGSAKIEKAIDIEGSALGVSIIMLVLQEDFEKLPDVHREAAKRVFAAPPRQSAATNDDALEYALGALRSITASGKNSSPGQLAAMAQAGIDLATLGADKCAEMRGDADPRKQRGTS